MIYFNLFCAFFKVGIFAFGAYGSIPLIREIVLSYGWLTDENFSYIIAVSESTPGPLMLNIATYVGNIQGGLPGSIIANIGVVLPSFLIILTIASSLRRFSGNQYMKIIMNGLKPCITGIILATGCYMLLSDCVSLSSVSGFDFKSIFIVLILLVILYGYHFFTSKKLSPLFLICIAGFLGIIL